MPPKKKVEVEKKVLLGRPRNTLKMGLVGLPNVGKSTTFNVMSNLNVPAENYPFCTIEPSEAKIFVHDDRFVKLCEMYKPKSKVSASISIFDIAGLVKGASSGAGLGNAFLSHIDAVDGIYHMVRAFPNEEVIHEEGDVDPVRDMQIITEELFEKDRQKLAKIKAPIQLQIDRKNDRIAKEEMAILDKVTEMLTNNKPIRDGDWAPKEIDFLNTQLFMTAKPVVYLVNIGYEEYKAKKNKYLPKIAAWIKENGGGPMLPFSAEFEKDVMASAGCLDKDIRDQCA
jgi:obg-like ATPase 1